MTAVRMQRTGGPEVLEVVEVERPIPGRNEILVRAHSIGVGRPDCAIRRGSYKWMPPLPCIPGNELAGVVETIGEGVTDVRPGQPVLVSSRELPDRGGCYAQFVKIAAHAAITLPDDLDLEAAVCLPNYQVAWALSHHVATLERVRSVYLNGAAGGVGTALIHVFTQLGVEVIAGAGTPEKRQFTLIQGAAHAIDTTLDDVADQVKAVTAGRGVDLVLDHLGGNTMPGLLDMLAPFGTLVSYNLLAGLPVTNMFTALRERIAVAPAIRCFNMHTFDQDRKTRRLLLETPIRWFRDGRIRPPIHARLPLSQVRVAHQLMENRGVLGKLVLEPIS